MEKSVTFCINQTELENLRLAICFNDQYLTACIFVFSIYDYTLTRKYYSCQWILHSYAELLQEGHLIYIA